MRHREGQQTAVGQAVEVFACVPDVRKWVRMSRQASDRALKAIENAFHSITGYHSCLT